jgi:hypothetical protein
VPKVNGQTATYVRDVHDHLTRTAEAIEAMIGC